MAQKYITQLLDDIDGTEAQQTVTFSLDGKSYAIDLSDSHAAEFRDACSAYVIAARKSDVKVAKTATPSTRRNDLSAVREWAAASGFEVAARGRIPENVQAAYDAVH